MTFGDIASLAIAYSDLKAVEAVTKAINANLPKTGPLGTIPAGARPQGSRPPLRATSTVLSDPRVHRTAAQTVVQTAADRRGNDVAVRPAGRFERCCPAGDVVICFETYKRSKSPIPPVWATMPPVPHVTTERVVKLLHRKVDLLSRGTVLDMFV